MNEEDEIIHVELADGQTRSLPVQTPVRELLDGQVMAPNGLPFIGALVNNDTVSLSYPLEVNSHVEFQTLGDPHGWRIYRRTASFLLAKTVKELFPTAHFAVEHSLGAGFYCNFEDSGSGGITAEQVEAIEKRMRELVDQGVPIVRSKISFTEAVTRFEEEEQSDKYNLLRYRNPPKIVIYSCEGFSDLAHGPLADDTMAISHFKLVPYEPGFMILFPDREHAPHMPEFEPQPHLFQIFKEHKEWGRILGVRTAGDLNEIIANRETHEFIRIAEAFHEKKIAEIADEITSRGSVRCILIAGPSSSGKTTFAKRLATQLRVNGLRPVTLSADNYFVDRGETPKGEDGKPDFEHIEAIDLELFNRDLLKLDRGEKIDLPKFNFTSGTREYKGEELQIAPDQLIIVEGIHGLNPRLTEAIPTTHKYRIYISALTQLNLDFTNRISTTDNRLIRRIVRDGKFRSHSALQTLTMWPSVRRGEKRWVFPFQQEADIAFNSALDYELAVLKLFVEPVLAEVKPDQPQYAEARRLMDFLTSFLYLPADFVPAASLLREFIGDSTFRY